MSLEKFLLDCIGFCDFAFTYYVILLGRAVIISLCMLAVICVFRRVVFANGVFLRGAVWGGLLLAPFMGKMKWIYETHIGVRLLYPWQEICIIHRWIPCIYVMGMICTAIWIFRRRENLRREVKKLRTVAQDGEQTFTNADFLQQTGLAKTQFVVSDCAVSPFTTGLFKPVVVVPEMMLSGLPEEELKVILMHEGTHIRLGHLWCFLMWDILRILLWPNFFLHLSTRTFRSDMEDICDCVTMQKSSQSPLAYGSLLLKSIQMLKDGQDKIELSAAFAAEQGYGSIRRRMKQIADFKPYSRLTAGVTACGSGLLLLLLFVFVLDISYPRYTDFDEMTVYNVTGHVRLVEDCSALREVIRIENGEVCIDRKGFERILADQDIEEEIVLLYFGGFSKLPGVGGGGDAVLIDRAEVSDEQAIQCIGGKIDLKVWLSRLL
ncbi:MAG: M56 family metallopeptidase [Lachnospiraceae bacterium]|nr:M56 family metallopeptidase [Lachnospiraceae bacterium]